MEKLNKILDEIFSDLKNRKMKDIVDYIFDLGLTYKMEGRDKEYKYAKANIKDAIKYYIESKTKISITYICKNCLETITTEVNKDNFESDDSPCDLCGSHGYVNIDICCTKCKKFNTIEIKSW